MMNIVKVISTKLDDQSRRLIKYLRMGKSDVRESLQASPYGTDSNPIADMVAVYAPTLQNGKPVIIGYVNKNQIADVGEHRIFSTDADGLVKMFIHLKNDGTAEFGGDAKNMVRFQELETGFNQLKSDFNSFITTFNIHLHAGVTPGIGTTASPITPGTPSAADISGAKIDEIKTL